MVKRYTNGEEIEHIVTDQLANMFHCPDCGFEYHAQHVLDDSEGGYTCPLCELAELRTENKQLERYLKGISENPDNMENHMRAREALKD